MKNVHLSMRVKHFFTHSNILKFTPMRVLKNWKIWQGIICIYPRYKLTPWQFTTSGDWQVPTLKNLQKLIDQVFWTRCKPVLFSWNSRVQRIKMDLCFCSNFLLISNNFSNETKKVLYFAYFQRYKKIIQGNL